MRLFLLSSLVGLLVSCGTSKSTSSNISEGQEFLEFCQNKAKSFSQQETIKALMELVNAGDCKTAKKQLINKTRLDLSGKNLKDITPLRGLTNIVWLDITGNNITDINPISGIGSLETLYANGNPVQSLAPLNGHKNIKVIAISQTKIAEVKLDQMPALERLYLTDSSIKTVNLKDMDKLETIDFMGSKMDSLSLTNLKIMKLIKVPDTDLKSLSVNDLPKLGIVDVRGTKISDETLKNLKQHYKNLTIIK